jgi:hypothetical protein
VTSGTSRVRWPPRTHAGGCRRCCCAWRVACMLHNHNPPPALAHTLA